MKDVIGARGARLRFAPPLLAAGLLSAALLAASTTGTLSGFVATITNTTNTAATGTLIMQEQNAAGTVTCLSTDNTTVSTNSATCATINKFGGSVTMVPGTTVSTNIAIKNVGTVAASSFSLTPGTCTQGTNGAANGTATDLCSKLQLVVTSGATAVYSGTLAGLVTNGPVTLVPPAAGVSTPYTFAVTLASGAGNTYQGLSASLPLTWTFNS